MNLQRFDGIDALGPEWDALFDAGPGVQSRRTWFEATEAAAMQAASRPLYLGLLQDSGPAALLPLRRDGRRLASLTSPYSVLFQPLLRPDIDPTVAGLNFGRHLRAWPTTLLEALDPTWPGLDPLLAGLRRAGLPALRFDQFGNWHRPVEGLGWPGYLASRPGALRETLRRKGRLAERDPTVRFEVARCPAALPAALAAYETVYARSWKVPEPFPAFNDALLSRLAAQGTMRLGVMWQGVQPIAAQYWTVEAGIATVLKLAHDDTARALSPGTLLTAHMIRALLEDGAAELDFGRGDDPYKRQWAECRRPRIGVMLASPRHPAGLAALVRHQAGRLRRGLRQALRQGWPSTTRQP